MGSAGEVLAAAAASPVCASVKLFARRPSSTQTALPHGAASWCSPLTPGEVLVLPDTWKAPVFHMRSEAATTPSEGSGVTATAEPGAVTRCQTRTAARCMSDVRSVSYRQAGESQGHHAGGRPAEARRNETAAFTRALGPSQRLISLCVYFSSHVNY